MNKWGKFIIAGVIWGLCELFLGKALYHFGVKFSSVYLNIIAIMLILWGYVKEFPLSGTLLGLISAGFKAIGTAPYWCHLAGITCMGIGFDIARLIWDKRKELITPFIGYALFIFIMRYVAKYSHWIYMTAPEIIKYYFVRTVLISFGVFVLNYVVLVKFKKELA